jgi:general secretion pathway protein G
MTTARARQRGLTLIEFVVVLLVVGIVGGVFLERLHRYQELAERAGMEAMLRIVKTGLQIRLAELIVTNRQAEAASLEQEDPMQWLDARPPNYGGDYREPPEPGKWYYDGSRRQLVYVVHRGSGLELDADGGTRELRFEARLLRDRIKAGGAVVEAVTGIALRPIRPYRWSGRKDGSILAIGFFELSMGCA